MDDELRKLVTELCLAYHDVCGAAGSLKPGYHKLQYEAWEHMSDLFNKVENVL